MTGRGREGGEEGGGGGEGEEEGVGEGRGGEGEGRERGGEGGRVEIGKRVVVCVHTVTLHVVCR